MEPTYPAPRARLLHFHIGIHLALVGVIRRTGTFKASASRLRIVEFLAFVALPGLPGLVGLLGRAARKQQQPPTDKPPA